MSNLIREPFFFVRHGETEWNSQNLCQGQQDIPLNNKGLLQAQTLASELKDLDIPCIVSSPLTRAQQTAKEIQNIKSQATFYTVSELAERYWGGLEGISSEEMYAIEKLEEQDPLYSSGQGVEKRSVFHQRVFNAMIKAQSYHVHPLIVSHGRVFMELCSILGTVPLRQIPSCQLYIISPIRNGWGINTLKK